MSTITLLKHAGVHETKRGPYIGTWSGKKFFPLDIQAGDICIEDIAHALSNMCRFSGHVDSFYSVAQHCVLVSMVVEDPLRGLLHDASEAYLVDVPRPIKKIADFSTYRTIERNTQHVIYKKFGVTPLEDPEWLHNADNLLLATEARDLMNNPTWARDMDKSKMKIDPWEPKYAEKEYLKVFNEYYSSNR